MEELPYADASFDVVTGFNPFPRHAAKPVAALKEAKRVARVGGQVAMVTWGKPQYCEHAAIMAAIAAFLPVPPTGAGGLFALSEPGRLEALLEQAGLTPGESGEIASTFAWPDDEFSSMEGHQLGCKYRNGCAVCRGRGRSGRPFSTLWHPSERAMEATGERTSSATWSRLPD